jgi:hypothetical protein
VTGIEPALSAWESVCHADADQGFAGQPSSRAVREYPLITGPDPLTGHATGTTASAPKANFEMRCPVASCSACGSSLAGHAGREAGQPTVNRSLTLAA